MPFSEKALFELRERLLKHHPELAMQLSAEELDALGTMLSTLAAASLKMRLRYRSVGRPLPVRKPKEGGPAQELLPGFGVDGCEGDATGEGR